MIISFSRSRRYLKNFWCLQKRHEGGGGGSAIIPCPCIEKLPPIPSFCNVGQLSEQPKIVIVGAGLAGLSAAQTLIQCGLNNVTILEAASRPGGRIFTCDCDRQPVDLGAQWIYGASNGNMIFNLACQEGLIKYPVNRLSPYRGIYLTKQGTVISEYICDRAIKEFDKINVKAKELHSKIDEKLNAPTTLETYFNKHIEDVLRQKFTKNEQELAARVLYSLTNDIKVRIGEDLNKIPATKYGAAAEIPGGLTAIKTGFKSILNSMLNVIPNIMYNKDVKIIKWQHPLQEQKRAELYCCDGSIIEADYVICTVSLGVLKRNPELFCPQLPPDKLNAIKKLGFGNIIKIFFEYKKPFWIENEGKFRLSWNVNELKCKDWINSIGLIEEAPSCDKSLLISVGGKDAYCLETLSTTEIAEKITDIMRLFLSNNTIPYPKNVIKSNWGHSTYTSGSVTYLGEESYVSHIKTLASTIPDISETIAPIVLFAGEATVPGYYGTVQGARLSGIREAERILMITKRFRGKPIPDTFAACN
ncbi:hypothetical protein O3M35_012706 [Rhynocoris fuscipes]|uniref:Amine oxidase n=1 Tax=Rhynocoris fuscipes TaxID=488301 RepID=A0AAW1CVT9_9HEMI